MKGKRRLPNLSQKSLIDILLSEICQDIIISKMESVLVAIIGDKIYNKTVTCWGVNLFNNNRFTSSTRI